MRTVGYDFFDVFNVGLIAGRVFDRTHAEDLPRRDPLPSRSIVVDLAFVSALGLGTPEEAIDGLVYRPLPPNAIRQPTAPPPMRIVGVVEDRSFSFFKTPGDGIGAIYGLQSDLETTVARVAASDLDGGLRGIDTVWRELAPNVAVSRRFLDEVFENAFAQYVRINQLFATLAVMAFGICMAGLFAMATFVTGRRRHEIGVRKTLGASTARMIALLLVGFSKPVLFANVIAWPAGYFASRLYLNQFSESIALTPWVFVLPVAITLAIACLAVVSQTIRAARTAPGEVLRKD
jgi:putative ABC transport system permease protein